MSQHDFNIANQTFPSFRSDLNDALQAAATMSAGASAPTTPYAYQLWFDTTTDTWKVRNSGNTAWISTITTDLATGNAGIGTSSPDETVQVFQTAGSGNNYNEGTLKVGGSTTALGFQFGYHSISSGRNVITSLNNGGGANQRISIGFGAVDSNGEPATNVMTLNQSGNVGIGISNPSDYYTNFNDLVLGSTSTHSGITIASGTSHDGSIAFADGTSGDAEYKGFIQYNHTNNALNLGSNGVERMRIDSSGNLHVGKTSLDFNAVGVTAQPAGVFAATRDGGTPVIVNRKTSDGELVQLQKDGSTVGSIGTLAGFLTVGTGDTGLLFQSTVDNIQPFNLSTNGDRDNAIDIGDVGNRFQDIYATNGTIQTSDANEKQQIATLTDAEITAAKAISQLFKTYKWNSAVTEKGDAARTHTGVIAQDVQAAMTAAGLDAGDYAFFISSTWWEKQTEVPAVEAVEAVYEDVVIPAVLDEDGNEVEAERTVTEAVEAKEAYTRINSYRTAEEAPEGATERTRMGIRYPELLAFVGAATEQRLANIETRLTALEA